MNEWTEDQPVLKFPDGVYFEAGPEDWTLEPVSIDTGSWVALVPAGDEPVVDPSGGLARILSTMAKPLRGSVRLFGQEIYRLDYKIRQRMRARIGFVHGYGGLLSNRSIRDNIALPASVHGRMKAADESALVDKTLSDFALDKVGALLPHDVDGGTRWRACLARALVLSPQWLVLEGLGNWEMDRGRGKGWTQLLARQRLGQMATVICLPRKNPGFQTWFAEHDGKIVHYSRSNNETLENLRR